jgi:hypothetical protein
MKQGSVKEVEVGEKNDDVVGAIVRVSLGLTVMGMLMLIKLMTSTVGNRVGAVVGNTVGAVVTSV